MMDACTGQGKQITEITCESASFLNRCAYSLLEGLEANMLLSDCICS